MSVLLTDEEIARALDVSRPTVERWRRGETAPVGAMMPLIIDCIAKAQAEISFKAGIKEVVEWVNDGRNHIVLRANGEVILVDVMLIEQKEWQAKLEEWGMVYK